MPETPLDALDQAVRRRDDILIRQRMYGPYLVKSGLLLAAVQFGLLLFCSLVPLEMATPTVMAVAYIAFGLLFVVVVGLGLWILVLSPLLLWHRLARPLRSAREAREMVQRVADAEKAADSALRSTRGATLDQLNGAEPDLAKVRTLRELHHLLRPLQEKLAHFLTGGGGFLGRDAVEYVNRQYELLRAFRSQAREFLTVGFLPLLTAFLVVVVQFPFLLMGIHHFDPAAFGSAPPRTAFDLFYRSFFAIVGQEAPDWPGMLPQAVALIGASFGIFMLVVVASVGMTLLTHDLRDE